MDTAAARKLIADALGEIAPEIDVDELDATAPFAEEADLDSMDLLSLAEVLHEQTGVDIGAGDLPAAYSFDDLVAHLAARAS
jgi:acyl carrier protein